MVRVWIKPEPDAVACLTVDEYRRFCDRIQRKFGFKEPTLYVCDASVLEEWSHYNAQAMADGGVRVEVYRRTAK